MKPIGIVKEVNLYPVKSMQGVPVSEAALYWYGLNGDRKYAFVRTDTNSSFPWLTGRETPELLQYKPYFSNPSNVMASEIHVRTPAGQTLPLTAPELRREVTSLHGNDLSLLHLNRGTYDGMPVSLLSEATLGTLQRNLDEPLDPRRFRANLVLQTDGEGEEPETTWLGASLSFGERSDSARVTISHRTKRCVMIGLEPESGRNNPRILKEVARAMQACAGVYASVSKLGDIKVGDTVYLERNM